MEGVKRLHSTNYDALVSAGPRLRPLQQAHSRIIITGGHRSVSLLTKLLTLLCSAASNPRNYTLLLFDSITNPDSFAFNTIIRFSSRSPFPRDSLLFYRRMLSANLLPSNYTFTAVLKACADVSDRLFGEILHVHSTVCGFDSDCYVQTALLGSYAKCGDLKDARKLFDRMPNRPLVAWNSMISAYEQNGFAEKAIEMFKLMQEEGVDPDSATLVGLLAACARAGALSLGRWVVNYIKDKSLDRNVILNTSIINMYIRCGQVKEARELFDGLFDRNVITWTTMISGYGMHGHGLDAINLFRRMLIGDGPPPNDVTFVAALSACAHSGLVSDGLEVFDCMKKVYFFSPRVEHHVAMVDMFGRAGLLEEAMLFIEDSIEGDPGPEVWTAMLGACKMHKEFDLGAEVAEKLLEAEPENPAHYVLISNIYALAGKTQEVSKVRKIMMKKRLKKQIGCSLIEVKKSTHVFFMGDDSHPQTLEIYRYLEDLVEKMRVLGYIPQTETVLHDLEEEEEREFALRLHSEKLAVAFGLMNVPRRCGGEKTAAAEEEEEEEEMPIRVMKNLRICEDCHSAFKFMSVVEGREIVVRDKHRFHHFKEGFCSCKDYW